jgi:hypothetical protein
LCLVRGGGLEPPRCYPLAPQASASANSAISARLNLLLRGCWDRFFRGFLCRFGLVFCRGRRRGNSIIQHASGDSGRSLTAHDCERQRGNHKRDGRPSGCFGKHRCRAARTKYRLRTHSAESSRQIRCLTALQKYNDNQEQANDDVDSRDYVNHPSF